MLAQRGWHYILLIIVPLGYSSSLLSKLADYFGKQAIGLVSRRMCFALSIRTNFAKILSSSSTFLGQQFVTWRRSFTWSKVAAMIVRSCCRSMTVRSSTVDEPDCVVPLVWFTAATSRSSPGQHDFTLLRRSTSLVWSNYQNCSYWLLWSLTSRKGDFITKRSQYWDSKVQS